MIEKTLVLSIAHMKPETNTCLTEAVESNSSLEDVRFLTRFVPHEYGYIFFLSTYETMREKLTTETRFPELAKVLLYALDNDCTFVNFDRDALEVDALPTFEWEPLNINHVN